MYKLILISIILIFTYNLSAQTYVSGNISGTWDLSGSPYIVTNNITVVDLEIEPGVEVLFNDNYSFTITGNFTAIGTAQDSIYFKPNVSNSNGWKGITFNSESEGLKLSYCAIESSTENGVAVNTGSVIISNSRISNSTRSGLYVKNSTVDLEKNILNNNQENGLNLNTNSSAHIYTTLIRNNNSAGLYFEGAGIELYNSVIAQNHAEGIQIISPSDTFKCYNSTIVSNQTGLFNTDAAVWLENSIFWDNGVTEISNFGGNVDAKFCFIDAATMPDDLNDLGGNIVSTNSPGFVESSNYQLSETSVCVDGGNPDPAFYDQYFPPSLSTNINDIGAYGGPNAGKWYHPIFVNPANLNFGKVSWDSSKILKIVLKNYRNYPISVSDLDISGNDSEKYKLINEPPSYPYTIAIGDSLEVEVEFIPGEGSGQPFTGILNIQNDISPEIVNMTGMGVQANITLIPPSSLDFEDTQVTESSSRMLRIYNTGNDSLKISEFEMSNTDVFSTDVEWITVAPGLNDTVYVEFKPDSAEDYTETLIIHSNARGNENKSITLSGKGRSPVIHANQLLVDFGSIEIDSVKNSQISIQNIGNNHPFWRRAVRIKSKIFSKRYIRMVINNFTSCK